MGRRNSCLDFSISLFEIKSIVECAVIFTLLFHFDSISRCCCWACCCCWLFPNFIHFHLQQRVLTLQLATKCSHTQCVNMKKSWNGDKHISNLSERRSLTCQISSAPQPHRQCLTKDLSDFSQASSGFLLYFFRTSLHRLSSRFSSFDLSNISHLFLLLSQIAWFGLWADEKERRKDRRKMRLSMRKEEESLNLNTRLSVSLSLCGCVGMAQRALSIFSIKLCGFFH